MNVAEFVKNEKAEQGMVTTTMLVTPEQAQGWLDAMPVQRRLRRNRVEVLKRLIVTGRWRVLPHGLVVDRNGHVIDGQHRLTAVVETGQAVQMRVTFNADPGLFLAIDSMSSPKSLDDALRHEGVSSSLATIVASAVRMIFRADQNVSPFRTDCQPSNEEGIDVFYANDGLLEAASLALKAKGITPSLGVMAYYLYRGLGVDADRTREFADAIGKGEGLKAGHPALLLRNTWYRERISRVRREDNDIAVQVATCLNAYLRGKQMHSWRGIEFGKGKVPLICK